MVGTDSLVMLSHPDAMGGTTCRVSALTLDDLNHLGVWTQLQALCVRAAEERHADRTRLVSFNDEERAYIVRLFGVAAAPDLFASAVGVRKVLWLMRRFHDPDLLSEESEVTCRRLDLLASQSSDAELTSLMAVAFGLGPGISGWADDPLMRVGCRRDAGSVDWPAIYRKLSRRYGWTPRQIGELTMHQLRIFLDD
jgi:hypothetical protein